MDTGTGNNTAHRTHLSRTAEGGNLIGNADAYNVDRAIDDVVAEARGQRFLTQGKMRKSDDALLRSVGIPDSYFEDGGTAIAFPLYALNSDEPTLVQVRPGSPELIRGGQRFRLPMGATRGDAPGHLPADVNPIQSNRDAVIDVTRPLIVTEGAAKADSIISALRREGAGVQEAGVVSVTGVAMPIELGIEGDAPSLHPETFGASHWTPLLSGRKVVIAYDGDLATNRAVATALRRFADALTRERNAHVFVIDLLGIARGESLVKTKDGIDDLLAAAERDGKKGAMREYLRSAVRWNRIDRVLVKNDVLPAAPKPRPLAGAYLSVALDAWRERVSETAGYDDDVLDALEDERHPDGTRVDKDEVTDWVSEHIVWSTDSAGNPSVRATIRSAAVALGAFIGTHEPTWHLRVQECVQHFITGGDEDEARQLVSVLDTIDDKDRVADLLALPMDEIAEAIGYASIGASENVSLREAIDLARNGGTGTAFPIHSGVDRFGGKVELIAQVSARPDQHGIFAIRYDRDGNPIRSMVLPYVLAKWGIRLRLRANPDLSTSPDSASTTFSAAAILAGGRVHTYDGIDASTDANAVAVIRGLKGAGVVLREPISNDEKEAAARCFEAIGAEEREQRVVVDRMGWVRLPKIGHRWVSTYGAVGAAGVTDDVVALPGIDDESRLGLPNLVRQTGFSETATDEELLDWTDLLDDLLDLASDEVSIPLWGQYLRSFVPLAYPTRSAVVALVAEPGAMKSALASRAAHLMSTLEYGSSATVSLDRDSSASIANALPFLGHQLAIADDFRPGGRDRDRGKAMMNSFDSIVTASYEGRTESRANTNGTNRATKAFVGSVVVTAETANGVDDSRLQRTVVVNLRKGDVSATKLDRFSDKWTRGANAGRGRRIIASYVQRIAQALDEDPANPRVPANGGTYLRTLESTLVDLLSIGADRASLGAVQVVSGISTFVAVMASAVAERAVTGSVQPSQAYHDRVSALMNDFVRAESDVVSGIIDDLSNVQSDAQRDAETARRLVDWIRDAVESGRAFLEGPSGATPPQADRLGWIARSDRGRSEFATRPSAIRLGRVAKDGTKALILPGSMKEVARAAGENLSPRDIRARVSDLLAEGYEKKAGEMISGIVLDSDGRPTAMRGYVFDLALFGVEAIDLDARKTPPHAFERGDNGHANF